MKNWKQKISFISLFLILFCTVLAVKTEHTQAASGYQLYCSQKPLKVGKIGRTSLGREVHGSWQDLKSKKIIWYSTNKNIAKITNKDYECSFKGVRPGICYICAKFKGKTYKCKVVVYNAKKSNLKKLKIQMKGCIYNGEDYSCGCRIYNPNDFAVRTPFLIKVKTKRGVKLENEVYDPTIPAKGYEYIAKADTSFDLKGTSVTVTYTLNPKYAEPENLMYYTRMTSKKDLKVSKRSIQQRPSEYVEDGYFDDNDDYHIVKKEIKSKYYDVKYKLKNTSKNVVECPKTEIFLIKNNKVMGSFLNRYESNIGPGKTVSQTFCGYWPFKRWTRVVVVNTY